MESFLKKFSTLPQKFINDFFVIAKEEYDESSIVIDFNVVCEWLNIRKDNLKEIMIHHFEENYDYTIERKKKKQINSTGLTTYNKIYITPNCFKELCMISQSPKAKEVRKYFIEMEKLIKRYYVDIKDAMYDQIHFEFEPKLIINRTDLLWAYKKIGILETNQKPKTNLQGGVVYIIEAQNSDVTLYKIGKTSNLKKRLNTYNSGNANDVNPLFILPVDDIDGVERCIKNACKKFQYRKYKEVYEIDLDVLKDVLEKCKSLVDPLIHHLSDKKILGKK